MENLKFQQDEQSLFENAEQNDSNEPIVLDIKGTSDLEVEEELWEVHFQDDEDDEDYDDDDFDDEDEDDEDDDFEFEYEEDDFEDEDED